MALECLDKLLPLSNLTPSNAAPPVDSERGTPAGKDCGGVDQRPNSVESKQEASTVAALVDDVRSDGDRASQTISSRVNIDGNRGMGAKDTRDDMNGHEEDVIMKAGIHVASSPSVAPAIPTPAPASTEPNLHSCQGDDAKANLSADSDVVINTASYNDAFTLLEDLVGVRKNDVHECLDYSTYHYTHTSVRKRRIKLSGVGPPSLDQVRVYIYAYI